MRGSSLGFRDWNLTMHFYGVRSLDRWKLAGLLNFMWREDCVTCQLSRMDPLPHPLVENPRLNEDKTLFREDI